MIARAILAASLLVSAGAGATDFSALGRPEVVRAMLLEPERKTQLRCAAALVGNPQGPGDPAFIEAVAVRVAAEIGSRAEVDNLFAEQRRRMGAEETKSAERATAISMACHSLGPARAAAPRDFDRLLGPVATAPIPLPTAAQCLAAFRADRGARPPGNDLAADMIGPLEQKLGEGAIEATAVADWEKRYAAARPDAVAFETLTVTCLPAVAALFRTATP